MAADYIAVTKKLRNIRDRKGTIADASQIKFDTERSVEDVLSALEEGSIEIVETSGVDLNTVIDQNVYEVTGARNAPAGSLTDGLLTVTKLGENSIKQLWESNGLLAYRVGEISSMAILASEFYVNGELVTPTEDANGKKFVKLAAGESYTLSGYLYGHIIIGDYQYITNDVPQNDPNESTELILNGLTILSDIEEAIEYRPSAKKLKIFIKKDTKNLISTIRQTSLIESDPSATIFSNNNLELSGYGLLYIGNTFGGHGIKGDELLISGHPYIYIDASNGHDGIHGSDLVEIENGYFKVCNVNDCVGTGSNGTLRIYGGHFDFSHFRGQSFDSKVDGYIYESHYLSYNVEPETFSERVILVNDETAPTIFGEGTIASQSAMGSVTETESQYTLSGANSAFIISGFISKPIVISAASVKVDITLDNAYILVANGVQPIRYNAESSRLEINIKKDTVNYVLNRTEAVPGQDLKGTAIKSKNNIHFKKSGTLYVESELSDAVDGDTLCFMSGGRRYFYSSASGAYGISSNKLYLGGDNDGVSMTEDDLGQQVYNDHDANIYASSIKIFNKSNIGAFVYYSETQKGLITADAIYVTANTTYSNTLFDKFYTLSEDIPFASAYSEWNLDTESFTLASESQIITNWTILKQKADIDLSGYATNEKVDNLPIVRTYTDIDYATDDLPNLELGNVVSVYSGASDDYSSDYKIYVVVKDSDKKKALKELAGGAGTGSYAGTVTFAVNSVYADGSEIELDGGYYECPIGSTLTFAYDFESQYYPDVRGTVYLKQGSSILGQENVYPNGTSRTISVSTAGYTTGTYTFTLYGVESTGKQSQRVNIRVRVGSLSLSSRFNVSDMYEAGTAITIPLKIESADTSNTITLYGTFNGDTIYEETVQPGTVNVTIPANLIVTGKHKIVFYLQNAAGKVSNILTYSIIVAVEGVIFVSAEKSEYEITEGSRLDVLLQTVQLNMTDSYFYTDVEIRNSQNELVSINGKTVNSYRFTYGSNLLQMIGLVYTVLDGTENEGTADQVDYSLYTVKFTVTSDDENALPANETIQVKVLQSNYNINITEEGLVCWFDAAGQSNTSTERDNWTDKSGNHTRTTFNNFNWTSNGWLEDESGNTALTLNAGSYVEIDMTPFYNEPENLTVEVDFATKDILESSAKVISCLYEYDGTEETIFYLRDAFGDYITNDEMNIIKYFQYAGGYCWLNGTTYEGDGIRAENDELPYAVTYSPSERTINYNKGDENESYNGTTSLLKRTGRTFKSVTKQVGFYIDTENAVLSNSSSSANTADKFHLEFSEDTRTKIDLIIERSEESGEEEYYFPAMIGYTNGAISLMKAITSNDRFKQTEAKGKRFKIYLGCKAVEDDYGNYSISDTGFARIYSLKIYNRALKPMEVLTNYAAEIPDLETKKSVIDNNGITDEDTLAKLPQVCLIGANTGTDSSPHYTINDFVMQLANVNESSISDLKAMKAPAYMTYTDPANTANSWINDGSNLIPIRLKFQGTSSMVYPLKNYKIKCYKDFTINGSNVVYSGKYKVDIGNGMDEDTFCIKADFMDSSHSNNTGAANFISDYNEITGHTPASALNPKLRTTIYGYPVLLYYKEKPTDTVQHFIGIGNFNLDKSCNGSFGLKKKVEDADGVVHDFGQPQFIDDEFGEDILKIARDEHNQIIKILLPNETSTLDGNGNKIVEDKEYTALCNKDGLIVAALSEKGYLRSVNNDNLSAVTCSEYKANSGADGAGGFGNYNIESVAADTELRYPDDGDLEDEEYAAYVARVGQENAITFKQFKSPYYYHAQRMIKWTKTASREEFLANLDRHFNINYLVDYYLTILLLGGVDSLGKNLMMATWGPENHLYVTTQEALSTDVFAFEYTDRAGNVSVITPTCNKESGEYEYATNEKGELLYYNEDVYSRYTKKFRSGYSSFNVGCVTTVPGESIWYPIFYDIDTICGLDNSGQLLFDVDIEVGDQLADGTAIFNTDDSYLWTKVRDYLSGETLASRWQTLRQTKFTADNLVGSFFYERQISKIPERYYNKDCQIKYIWEGPFRPGENVGSSNVAATVGSGSYLYCIHGPRYEQMKRWFTQRIYYLDSMFGLVGTTSASLRFNYQNYDANFTGSADYYANYAELANKFPTSYNYDPAGDTLYAGTTQIRKIIPIEFNFKTYQPGYVGVRWKNGLDNTMVRVGRGETVNLRGNVATSGDAEVFIFGGENVKEIGSMAPYNVKQVDFRNLTKLSSLILGDSDNSCVINKLDLGTNSYLANLQLVNCGSLTSVDVSSCSNLRTLDMTGSAITNASLPNGGALEYIAYSSAITAIELRNFASLNNVVFSSLNNLTTLIISDCPLILGSKTAYTSKAWNILQNTANSSSLTDIQLTSYGQVDPLTLANGTTFFFPNKYYDYGTAPNIRGVINYTGTTIPTYYTLFPTKFPYLTINYANITNAESMFENYNNINCIGTLSVYIGDDIYGNKQYDTVKYWTDSTQELQNKWHTTEQYLKYGASPVYSSNTQYYIQGGVYYRILGIYDEEDLANVRSEIKDHLSLFTRLTNVDKMFKGCELIDYLDDDTFNGIDLSTASTNQMFYGCTNLKYFKVPGDIVKCSIETVYYDGEGNLVEDLSVYEPEEIETFTTETKYINPITKGEVNVADITFVDGVPTIKYKKGIRNIGDQMFFNCKNVKVYFGKLPEETASKITISTTAFSYDIYDPGKESQASGVTWQRPVVLFEHSAKDLLAKTTATTSTYSDPFDLSKNVQYTHKPVEGEENLYYTVNNYGNRVINYSNNYFLFRGSDYLREVYFDITGYTIGDTTSAPGYKIDYATNSEGNRVLTYVKQLNSAQTTFNHIEGSSLKETVFENRLKLISVTGGALSGLETTTEIEIPLPQFDNLDSTRYTYDPENSIARLFIDKFYHLDNSLLSALETSVSSFYITNTVKIPKYAFAYTAMNIVGICPSVNEIKDYAFQGCENLQYIYWFNYNITQNGNIKLDGYEEMADDYGESLETIGESVFNGCTALTTISLPNTVTSLGDYAFYGCTSLSVVDYSTQLTIIPNRTFEGCTSLITIDNLSRNITEIGNYAFAGCTILSIINNTGGLALVGAADVNNRNFGYFTNLTRIGDYAFYNCAKVIPAEDTFSGGYPIKNATGEYSDICYRIIIPSTLTYLGSGAFYMERAAVISQNLQLELVWDLSANAYKDLVIGSDAFYNLRLAWSPSGDKEHLIADTAYLPAASYAGSKIYRAYDSTSHFQYVVTPLAESIVGSDWVDGTKKIIFEYKGINFNYETSNGLIATYLISNNGAYMRKVTSESTLARITIPTSIEFENESYDLIEILGGAFDDLNAIGSIVFAEDSRLQLIESNVLTLQNSANLSGFYIQQAGSSATRTGIPETLNIETGNNLTSWKNRQFAVTGFITLGHYIVGYNTTGSESDTLDFTTLDSKYDTIYDSAFENAVWFSKIKFNNYIKYIYAGAFSGVPLDYRFDTFVLPNHIIEIGDKAFVGGKFRKLYFPKTLVTFGSGVFSESTSSVVKSVLEEVEFESGRTVGISGSPFTVQREVLTNDETLNEGNVTLKTLILPTEVRSLTTTSFSEFRYLIQVKNLYLGNLEEEYIYDLVEDTSGSPDPNVDYYYYQDDYRKATITQFVPGVNYYTRRTNYMVDNYPLYLDSNGNYTYENTGTYARTNDELQLRLYGYKFYYRLTGGTGILETTSPKSVCPLGDVGAKDGYYGEIDISNIRLYPGAAYKAATGSTDAAPTSAFTRAELLMLLSGYSFRQPSKVRLKNTDYIKIQNDLSVLSPYIVFDPIK